jgi:hypothetical protein
MAYVDLNRVRARIAATPEDSDFTSIEARIKALAAPHDSGSESTDLSGSLPVPLLKFRGTVSDTEPTIPFHFSDYFELVDWTGRTIRADKRGAIDSRLPAIMQRLNVDASARQEAMRPSTSSVGPWADSINCNCMRQLSGRPGSEGSGRPIVCSVTE